MRNAALMFVMTVQKPAKVSVSLLHPVAGTVIYKKDSAQNIFNLRHVVIHPYALNVIGECAK